MTKSNVSAPKHPGLVYLVGAGPGDPGLLTLKGAQCLHQADVVMYDYLVDASLLSHAPEKSDKIYVGKESSHHTLPQEDINNLLVKLALEGKTVVRLKGGDPFIFGRGAEECEALRQARIAYEIVPGVTSGIGASAYAGIALTHRKFASSVAFVAGNEYPHKPNSTIKWEHLSRGVDTLVFYMGVLHLSTISAKLIQHGRAPSTPVAVVRWGTKSIQQTVVGTLETIVDIVDKAALKPPAIIIVGNVVDMRQNLEWFEKRPLFGKRIITTRARAQASELSRQLTASGAQVIELPTIASEPVGPGSPLAKAMHTLPQYDWIIFTSSNAATVFFGFLMEITGDVRTLGKARIASIGPGTSEAIKKYFVAIDITAEDSVAEGLLKELKAADSWNGKKVFFPRAEKARNVIPDALKAWGADVTTAVAYKTVKPSGVDASVLESIATGDYDLITFSSSSTFENFVELFGKEAFIKTKATLKAASIGPITSLTIQQYGVDPVVEAKEHSIAGLVESIEDYFLTMERNV